MIAPFLFIILTFVNSLYADTVILTAARDNTLYEDKDGSISNGAGFYLFAGSTGANGVRRSLLYFDLSPIPPGSNIDKAGLSLYMDKSKAGSSTLTIHRVLTDWGEGDSAGSGGEGLGEIASANDATWLHAFYPETHWNHLGGDYASQLSAVELISDEGWYNWTGDELRGDVELWVNSPPQNFGWMILGDESKTSTAKRFISRNFTDSTFHPRLIVDYSPPISTSMELNSWSELKSNR